MRSLPTVMKTKFTSLKTADLASGLALSLEMARDLAESARSARDVLSKPGGTNYAEPPSMPVEMIAGVMMVAVSIANDGWAKKEGAAG